MNAAFNVLYRFSNVPFMSFGRDRNDFSSDLDRAYLSKRFIQLERRIGTLVTNGISCKVTHFDP